MSTSGSRVPIVIHDYAGHPFPIELSIELARRGETVVHIYSASLDGVKADFDAIAPQPGLTVIPISIGRLASKTNFLRRMLDEAQYGMKAAKEMARIGHACIFSTNVPLVAHVICRLRTRNSVHVFWLQDRLGVAARTILSGKYGRIGRGIGRLFEHTEAWLARSASHVVAICTEFRQYAIDDCSVKPEEVSVIENWAALTLLARPAPPKPVWSMHEKTKRILYSGTLGFKHRPKDIYLLAKKLEERGINWQITVVSAGYGREVLENLQRESPCSKLELMDPVPYTELPEMLASADFYLATLEDDASSFCVPSKVLTYMAIGRPTLLIGPKRNRISEIIREAKAGLTIEDLEDERSVGAFYELLDDQLLLREYGKAALKYADEEFSVARKADGFLAVLDTTGPSRPHALRTE